MKIDVKNRILCVTLSAPATGNSFALSDAETLRAALKKYEKSEDVIGLLLSADGRIFCAGGNLKDYAQMTKASEGKTANATITEALRTLAEWPKPTAAAVKGDCFGGGVELISACDRIFCVPHAYIGLWQRRIGLSFGWGGGARIENRVGLARLRTLALEARSVSGTEALQLGLIDELVLISKLEDSASEWITKTASLPAAPVKGLKKFRAAIEASLFAKLWLNPEHRNALARRRRASPRS